MKKQTLTLLLAFICAFAFAQKVIENPEYGFSTYPGEITKIEMLDTTTVLHFKLKTLPWGYFHLHKESFIKDLNGDNNLFVSNLTGANFGRNDFPESGEVMYQLYFPPLSKTVKTIDFGVEKERGWHVQDIIIQEDENSVKLPKELKVNWLLADGSNRWDYGFNSKNAIVDGAIWNYKSVNKKRKKYTIILEKDGVLKTIYAKLNKNGLVDFGVNSKELLTYSSKKTNNPNYKPANDVEFGEDLFDVNYTTYSGVIKGYTTRAGQKTGTLFVNNVFTGNQESHLIKIADDGSFSVKLQIAYPQEILVRMFSFRGSVFVEPNKETFHYINGDESLFMGDCAKVNSDLQALEFIRFFDYPKTMENIGLTSPEDYKKICFDVRDKELNALKEFENTNGVGAKAHQIKKLSIDYTAFERILGYEMYRGSIERRNEKLKLEDKKPIKSFKVEKEYYDFISKDMINNKVAVLTSGYNHFINRLMYANIFKNGVTGRTTLVGIAEWLQNANKELSAEELEMVEMSKTIETPEVFAKQSKFSKVHGEVQQAFYKKYMKDYRSYLETSKEKPSNFILSMADYVKAQGIEITDEEKAMLEAQKVIKTPEELEKEKKFNERYGEVRSAFYKKHKDIMSDVSRANFYSNIDNKMYDFFGGSDAFMFDVIRFQRANKKLEDYKVYSDDELDLAKKKFNDPFLANYLEIENENTKIKIEENKAKGGYTVNTVEKSEGDELFDAMIEKFKGKVVYVDFWATWCGPCKSGITKIAPLKEEMKGEDVVFLYVTNQTSPEGTWKNSIPNIKGEHYRVSADEWNYLTEKFKISGIPHYTLVNKKGEVVKPKMGHLSNDRLKTVLKSEMEK